MMMSSSLMDPPPNAHINPTPLYKPYAKITIPNNTTTHPSIKKTIQTQLSLPPLNDNNTNYPSKKKKKTRSALCL